MVARGRGGAGGGSWVAAGPSLDIYPEAIKEDSSGQKKQSQKYSFRFSRLPWSGRISTLWKGDVPGSPGSPGGPAVQELGGTVEEQLDGSRPNQLESTDFCLFSSLDFSRILYCGELGSFSLKSKLWRSSDLFS